MDCPKLADLDPYMTADGWCWRQLSKISGHWIGTDKQGRDWLVKMTGSFNAMRERIFDLIAQEIGLSCQSCIFLTLPDNAEPLQHVDDKEVYQGAITYIQRHSTTPCRNDCEYATWLLEKNKDKNCVRFLSESRINNATDLLVGNILGYVCGALERVEFLISTNHRLFLIDNESTLLFPPDLNGAIEYICSNCPSNDWQLVANVLVPKLTCLANISDATLKSFTVVPSRYKIPNKYSISKRLPQFRTAARKLVRKVEKML